MECSRCFSLECSATLHAKSTLCRCGHVILPKTKAQCAILISFDMLSAILYTCRCSQQCGRVETTWGLVKFKFTAEHVPGKLLYAADAPSCEPSPESLPTKRKQRYTTSSQCHCSQQQVKVWRRIDRLRSTMENAQIFVSSWKPNGQTSKRSTAR